MAFWRTYYHLVWATKERLPLITPDIEQGLYHYIIGKADALECITHAINGMEDHLHLVVSIPPKLSVADFVQNIKGSSSYHINHDISPANPAFAWQRGYGIFTLGGRQLDDAIAYVVNQKTHHRLSTTVAALERCDEVEDGVQRRPAATPRNYEG